MRKSWTGKITIAAVAKLQQGETLNDDKLAGFSVRRQRTKAVYSLRGRLNDERVRITIGWQGRFTPEEARKEAKRLVGLLASGIDPRAKSSKHMTFAEAAKAFTEHAYAKRAKGTARGYEGHLKRYLIPKLGSRPFNAVNPATLATLHLRHRDQPVLANRVLDTASSLYGWAARKRLCPPHFNPASKRLVERYKEQARERFLSYSEVERLGHALRELEDEGKWSPFALAGHTAAPAYRMPPR